jgi:hypothetical protein
LEKYCYSKKSVYNVIQRFRNESNYKFNILENIMTAITFATLADAVNSAVDAHNIRLLNAYDAKVALAQSAPTIGKDNRLHAPHDGYIWGDSIYAGGQYLPEDEEQDKLGKVHNIKMCVNVSLLTPLQDLFHGGSMGKSWVTKNGVEVAYFYTVVSAIERTAIIKVIPTLGLSAKEKRIIVEVKEGDVAETTTWKWSDAKAHNKIMKSDCDIELAECLFSAGLQWYYEEGRKVKGKIREWYTGLDGKIVKYSYLDDTIYS